MFCSNDRKKQPIITNKQNTNMYLRFKFYEMERHTTNFKMPKYTKDKIYAKYHQLFQNL